MNHWTEALKARLDYTPEEAERVSQELANLDVSLRELLDAWMTNEDVTADVEIGEYSIRTLRERFGMNFIAALLTLDWMVKEPDVAIPAIEEGVE